MVPFDLHQHSCCPVLHHSHLQHCAAFSQQQAFTCRLPKPPGQRMERLRFFLYSCANWGFGYFNAYDVGSRYNLDFWVHLGDYVRLHLHLQRSAACQAVHLHPPHAVAAQPSTAMMLAGSPSCLASPVVPILSALHECLCVQTMLATGHDLQTCSFHSGAWHASCSSTSSKHHTRMQA